MNYKARIIIGLWTLLNLVQSAFTGLFHDEALFWFCSQHMDWGFWDHPPAAPLLIYLGYAIVPAELGARLFIVLASSATVYGLWKLVQPSDNRLFFTLLFSIFLVHIGGFFAAPDIPLLLFSVWFMVLYRRYLDQDHWLYAVGLGVLAAGMAYSKYHGAVFLFFALLGHLSILRRASFWIIPALALALFSPHLIWQWVHEFPTFRYHLVDRAGDPYQWTFITDYLGGQLVILGPLVVLLLLPAAWKNRSGSSFDRVMKWSLWGVLGFFLFQSFSQRTEANWTATAIIPLVYLSYPFIAENLPWRKWLYRLAIPSFLFLALFRSDLIFPWLPDSIQPRREYRGWDLVMHDIADLAGDRPVVFLNTYKMPAKFQFYTGKPAHSININGHAGNQNDLLPQKEVAIQGQEVLVVSGELKEGTDFSPGGIIDAKYQIFRDFRSFNRVRTKVLDSPKRLPSDTAVNLRLSVLNRSDQPVLWEEGGRKVTLEYWVLDGDELALKGQAIESFPGEGLAPEEEQYWQVQLRTPKAPGEYRFRYNFHVEGLFSGRSGNFRSLEVY